MKYKIIVEETAEKDLLGILSYISETLHDPNVANKLYNSIKTEILSLKELPFRYAVVSEEPYGSMGVRKIPIKNYTVFYIIDDGSKTVHIFRILYNRREWQYLL